LFITTGKTYSKFLLSNNPKTINGKALTLNLMFKCPPLARTQALFRFRHSSIVLSMTSWLMLRPATNRQFQFVKSMHFCFTQTLMHDSSYTVVNRIKIWALRWLQVQRNGSMFLVLYSSPTVSCARCTGELLCIYGVRERCPVET